MQCEEKEKTMKSEPTPGSPQLPQVEESWELMD